MLPIELQEFNPERARVQEGDNLLVEVGTNTVLVNFGQQVTQQQVEAALKYFDDEGVMGMQYQVPQNL